MSAIQLAGALARWMFRGRYHAESYSSPHTMALFGQRAPSRPAAEIRRLTNGRGVDVRSS